MYIVYTECIVYMCYVNSCNFISAGPPANLTYGPPSTPSQFTPQNSMRWSGDPIQQQNPLLSPSQVIAGTPATNLPSPATGSHQGVVKFIGIRSYYQTLQYTISYECLHKEVLNLEGIP